MAKRGPKGPSTYRSDFHPRSFVELSKGGKNKKQISASWGITTITIRRWVEKYPKFCSSVEMGEELCEAWYTDIGQAAMLGQARTKDGQRIEVDFKYFKWMTQNICKWSERLDQKVVSQNTNTDVPATRDQLKQAKAKFDAEF